MTKIDLQTVMSMVTLAGSLVDLAGKAKVAFGAADQATVDRALADIRAQADAIVPAAIAELRQG